MALQTVNVCANSNLRFFGMCSILFVNSKWPNNNEFCTSKDTNLQYKTPCSFCATKVEKLISCTQSTIQVLNVDVVLWGRASWILVQNSGYSTTFKWVMSTNISSLMLYNKTASSAKM